MDWRAWYRDELASEAGRAAVAAAVARHAGGDAEVAAVLREGGSASFPHTTLRDSADPLARVAGSIVAAGFTRVVALGVLHGGTLAEPHRSRMAALVGGGSGSGEAFRAIGGAWFGGGPRPGSSPWVREDASVLAHEFSLDLFLSVLASVAAARGVPVPEVSRVFVGPTRSPDRSFAAGQAVADALRPLLGPGVALVATGDLVHFGHGYSQDAEIAALPADADARTAHFRTRVEAMLDAAFARGDLAAAYDASTLELRNDQRNLLPVLAALVPSPAEARLLSFRLTDYGPILGRPSPCVVATALAVIRRRARGRR